MFIKYHTMHAWGNSDWKITEISKGGLEDFVNEIHSHYDYSDKYRGVNVVRLKKVPKFYIEQSIKYMESKSEHLTSEVQRYKNLLNSNKVSNITEDRFKKIKKK